MSSLQDQFKAFNKSNVVKHSVLRAAPLRPGSSSVPVVGGVGRAGASATAPVQPSVPERSVQAVNFDLHRVMKFLKDVGKGKARPEPQTIDSIFAATGLRLDASVDPQLWTRLAENSKVDFSAEAKTFMYRPDIAVNTKEELLQLLQRRLLEGSGLDLTDRNHDSNLDIKTAVRELEAEGKVLVLRSADNRQERMAFYNETRFANPVDAEFVTQWQQLKLPDVAEMHKQLEAKGHTVSKEVEKRTASQVAAAKGSGTKKRVTQRKVKLTNEHMAHLFKDDFKSK